MRKINIVDTGHVYQNPKPHLCARGASFPTLVQLDDGELLAAMDIGSAFESLDIRSYLCRSTDGGRTWSEPEKIFDPDESEHPVSTTCRIGRVDGGDLLGWVCLFDRTRVDEGFANYETGGFCRTDFATIRSTDNGKTWSELQPVKMPVDWHNFETCAPPMHIGEGKLITLTSASPNWEGEIGKWGPDGFAFFSPDNGNSWTNLITVFTGCEHKLTGYEQDMTHLSDGRWMAMCWTWDFNVNASVRNRMAFSHDPEQGFDPPLETPLNGETPRLISLGDDLIFVAYRRTDKRGLWAALARINGTSWDTIDEELLWGGEVVSHRTDLESHWAQMGTLKFGCPAITQLAGGDLLIIFWGVEDGNYNIPWVRVSVDL
jgi:hypothetical protein